MRQMLTEAMITCRSAAVHPAGRTSRTFTKQTIRNAPVQVELLEAPYKSIQ